MIVLDACRYDIFQLIFEEYLDGKLYECYSPASCTLEWLKATFPDYYELTYYSGNPHVNPKVEVYGYRAWEHFAEIIFAWKEWDRKLKTLLPSKMNEMVLNNKPSYRRIIIHYIQPHLPPAFSHQWIEELHKRELKFGEGGDVVFFDLVRKGVISPKKYKQLYIDNLRVVLRCVADLIPHLNYRKIVITSDHGEFLGEEGKLGHPCNVNHNVLRRVPWLEVR